MILRNQKVDFSIITEILDRASGVIAAWLFGSAQDGHVPVGSDIDFGILFEDEPSLQTLLDLYEQIARATEIEEIDLIVLNTANPILAFEAVSGKSVYCRDKHIRAEFVSLTAREYEDTMAMIQDALS